jgi:hypothetical protein
MIQHFFNNQLNLPLSIFKDAAFHETRGVLDSQMRKGATLGLVKSKKQAVAI